MNKKPRKVRVRGAEGQIMPGRAMGLDVITPETDAEVVLTTFVRRRIARGDLVVIEDKPKREAPKRPARKSEEK